KRKRRERLRPEPTPQPAQLFVLPGAASSSNPDDSDARTSKVLALLAGKTTVTARALAARAGLSESVARSRLKALVAAGLAGEFRDGRKLRYWALGAGARPDLGMNGPVVVLEPRVDQLQAAGIGRALEKNRVLGLLGERESFAEARLGYR